MNPLTPFATETGNAEFVVRGKQDKADLCEFISKLDDDTRWEVEIHKHKKARSDAQNRLSHVWYREIGSFMGITEAEAKARCKLKFGVQILAKNDKWFEKRWQELCEAHHRVFLLDMMELIPITSLMDVEEFSKYLTELENYFGPQGCPLSHPDTLFPLAMGEVH
jgi:hypothetical protein